MDTTLSKPQYFRCGCCECLHDVELPRWVDCREDTSRFNPEDLDAAHGPYGWDEIEQPEA